MKERWKAKAWYKIHAPGMLNFAPVSETMSSDPETVMGRITKVSLQGITQDMRHKNILIRLQVNQARGYNLYTKYLGHQLTNDYIRLLTRRRHSKVDGIFELTTKDEVRVRIKPMVITDKRIQTSQQRAIRSLMLKALDEFIPTHSIGELFHEINTGDLNRNLAKDIRVLYPTKRVEIRKLDVISAPDLMEVPPDPDAKEDEELEEKDEEVEDVADVTETTETVEETETGETDEGETEEVPVAEETESVPESQPEPEPETELETKDLELAEPDAPGDTESEEILEAEVPETPETPETPKTPTAPETEEILEAEAVEEASPEKNE